LAVPDQRPPPSPGPRPRDENEPLNYVVDRRKVVFGLGFGVMTAAGVRHLDEFGVALPSSSQIETSSNDVASSAVDTSIDTEVPTNFADAPPTNTAFDAPVLDAAKRLAPGQTADVVFVGGRVIDPETGFDRIANVALSGSTIVEISDQPIAATREIPAGGLVISPGFIDMLSYEPNGYGEWWKVADGVTTNVGLHGLRFDASEFYDEWTAAGVPINFGGSVHNSFIRQQAAGVDIFESADGSQIQNIVAAAEAQVNAGYLGIHVQPEYAPGVSPTELNDMGVLAERLGVPLSVHARFSDNQAPGLQSEAITELVSVARNTGCHVHVEHINSTGGTGRMAEALGEIDLALAEGLRMSTCMYPYEFWATYLKAARFDNWQEKYGISYGDLQVAGTNQRLTIDTYEDARDNNALTAAFAIPAGDLDLAIQAPFMMIGSDAILERPHNNHPRSTGCFARTIAQFSRTKGLVDLPTALAMMTIRPATLLAISSPQMARKGRMQIGADADITAFDPLTIADTSTIENPAQESVGVRYVFVNGTEVRNPEGNITTARPGVAIRSARS
jgi:N-acyl-D-aspartate/D-glutamate deacylase